MALMAVVRPSVLFVDDEPGIRETLPIILEMHGFDVVTAGSVAEALAITSSRPFDVLISDLNIGSPGDGFTVVSAMRRTHPTCVNFILTGYPAFDTALQAIRNQVDEYLIKPADPGSLIAALKKRLENRIERRRFANKRVTAVLHENMDEIARRARQMMEAEPLAGEAPPTPEDRLQRLLPLLRGVCERLESVPAHAEAPPAQKPAQSGDERQVEGYSSVMLVADVRLLERAIHDVLHENLLELDLSQLMPDLKGLNEALLGELEENVRLLSRNQQKAA